MSVRFAGRFIRASVIEAVREFLTTYGWIGQAPPFGTTPVNLRVTSPTPSDLRAIEGNTVFVSFGDEADVEPFELGGGNLRQEYVVFVDVIGVDDSMADAIAGDVKDRLSGLFGGTRYLRPRNPGTNQPLPGYVGEFTDIAKHIPDGERRNWRTVSCTLVMDFPGEES